MDLIGGGEDHRALHRVPQLPDVARPMMALEHVPHLAGEGLELLVHLPAKAGQEMIRQQDDIPVALPQRRHPQLHHV